MPVLYLSPSTQESNPYIIGGSEEYYMNLVADAMEPYLTSSGITYYRNTPSMTAASSIRQSNQIGPDFHLALHSNAAPDELSGRIRGVDVYYYPGSSRSMRAAQIIADNFKDIYPVPSRVRPVPTTAIGEVSRTNAPAVLIEMGYHDNVQDATWISQNIQEIAANLVRSMTEYFGIPFVLSQPQRQGTVRTTSGNLNIRQRPSLDAPIIASVPSGTVLTVTGQYDNWYVVRVGDGYGYAYSDFVNVE